MSNKQQITVIEPPWVEYPYWKLLMSHSILFCSNPLHAKEVDTDWQSDYALARIAVVSVSQPNN